MLTRQGNPMGDHPSRPTGFGGSVNNENIIQRLQEQEQRLTALEKRDTVFQNAAVDFGGTHNPSQIICIGYYRGRSYVETFRVRTETFQDFIDYLRRMRKANPTNFFFDAGPTQKEALIEIFPAHTRGQP